MGGRPFAGSCGTLYHPFFFLGLRHHVTLERQVALNLGSCLSGPHPGRRKIGPHVCTSLAAGRSKQTRNRREVRAAERF
jgi:hypothetical protein